MAQLADDLYRRAKPTLSSRRMTFRFLARTTAPALLLLALAAPAHAQTFADQTLGAGWSSYVINSDCAPAGGCSGSGTAIGTGGNSGTAPDPYRAFTHVLSGGIIFVFHESPFSWDPSTQGAITSASSGFDYDPSGGNGGSAIAFELGVRQGSDVFIYYASYDAPFVGSGWHTMNYAFSTDGSNWCRQTIGTVWSCPAGAPDLSASGAPITFGIITANSGSYQTLGGGLDDFEVTVNGIQGTTAPEPASLALVAGGLVGLAGVARRRRARR